jgi:hypothetical protein
MKHIFFITIQWFSILAWIKCTKKLNSVTQNDNNRIVVPSQIALFEAESHHRALNRLS